DLPEVRGEARRIRRTHPGEVGMRAGPHAEPLAIAPVPEVVQRPFCRTCPVRDLVVAVPGGTKVTFSLAIHRGDGVFARLTVERVPPPPLEHPPSPARPVGDGLFRIEPELE